VAATADVLGDIVNGSLRGDPGTWRLQERLADAKAKLS
jgi:hypothetical protein